MQRTGFAKRLAAAMKAAGVSQYELARRAGVAQGYISELLSGKYGPGWETVQKLAAALEISTEDLKD
jgi:transcriptional regulator with XRE-family HTH domain